jgi:Na+/H+ antiporter NhaC
VLEDSGTITSPLVPGNTCGAHMADALGVPTLAYLPCWYFNLLTPFDSALCGFTGLRIEAHDLPGPSVAAMICRTSSSTVSLPAT